MGCNKAPGEYYIDFDNKSELDPPYYTNQIPMNQNNTGFVGNCTWYVNDRLRQITGFKMESLASGWGDGGQIWRTAQKFGFPVYNAQEALNHRGTLAGYVISFETAKAGYGTHVAVVESYDPATKTAWVSEMWGSQNWTCAVHLVKYTQGEMFHADMHYIDFSSIGLDLGVTADDVRKIYQEAKTIYNTVDELPFGQETIQKLIDKGLLAGVDDKGNLGLSYDLLRNLVINDRAGLYDK